jgi:hypothetical protein
MMGKCGVRVGGMRVDRITRIGGMNRRKAPDSEIQKRGASCQKNGVISSPPAAVT